MEDLVASFSTQTRVSLEDDDVALIHPRYDQYKQKTIRFNQEERRRQWLLEQRNKRLESFNFNRGLNEEGESLDSTEGNKTKPPYKEKNLYKDWLMLSVWLVDVPEELEKEWYFSICPVGKRALVIAEKGQTKSYTRHGDLIMKFPSELPGGRKENSGYTVIDCIWDHISKTYFILDVLIWGIPLTNCEAELRFFWLKNKYAEIPELGQIGKSNRHKFVLLDHNYVSDLQQSMLVHPVFENNEPKVDGIIFFHKDSLYTSGKSQLVTWLKPFMISDMLNIKVADEYYKEIPPAYTKKKKNQMEVDTATAVASTSSMEVTAEQESEQVTSSPHTALPVST